MVMWPDGTWSVWTAMAPIGKTSLLEAFVRYCGNGEPIPRRETKMKKCPRCGEEFDPAEYEIVTCQECGDECSTKCCCPGGKNCLCTKCEEAE